MKNQLIDKLNFILLWVSFYIAIKLPFELFLFSYAVLGPLHYLTEINWLNDKNYFIKAKKQWYIPYAVFAFIIALYSIVKFLDADVLLKFSLIGGILNILLFSGFLFAISLVSFSNSKQLMVAFILSLMCGILVYFLAPAFLILVGVFLPTLVHVYIFTLFFMAFGTLKTRGVIGIINIVLLIIIPLLIFGTVEITRDYGISEYTKNTYIETRLINLNTFIAQTFGVFEEGKAYHVMTKIGVKIQIFIAFTYTYHYLNWFSKTSIIGWKNSLSSNRFKYIIILWVLAMLLYLYDYKTGLVVLLFLSFIHVFLEFPLNIISIKSLFKLKKP